MKNLIYIREVTNFYIFSQLQDRFSFISTVHSPKIFSLLSHVTKKLIKSSHSSWEAEMIGSCLKNDLIRFQKSYLINPLIVTGIIHSIFLFCWRL